MEKALYLKKKAEELHDSIINVKSCTTSTVDTYTWTFRTTACDVISIITTTVPIKNGTIIESKSHNKEMKRYEQHRLIL